MWYDVLTVCVLTYATFRGSIKGIVWQLATIASLLFCFFFAGSLSATLGDFIRVEPPLNRWIAMLILYLGFSFVSFGIARALHDGIERLKIDALDRHLGALLGLLKGGVFSIFLTFFLATLSHAARESIMESESGYVAAVIIDRLDSIIPGDLHALLEPYIRRAPEIEREHRGYVDDRRHRAEDGDGRLDDGRDPRDRDPRDRDPRDRDRDLDRRGLPDRGPDVADRHDLPPGPRDDVPDTRDPGLDARDRRPDPRDPGPDIRDRRPDGADRGPDVSDRRLDRDPARRPVDPFTDVDPDRAAPRSDRLRDDDRRISDRRRPLGPDGDDRGVDDRRNLDSDDTSWLSTIPALTDELKQLALRAWRNTKPEHRGEFRRRLSSGSVPDLIRKTLRDWQNGRPAPTGQASAERNDLERDIVASRRGDDSSQSLSIDDIEDQLRGIPDDVALNVLRDWRSDLRGDKSDPDSDTSSRTTVIDRIRRQLKRSGVSIRDLDTATQDRLRRTDVR